MTAAPLKRTYTPRVASLLENISSNGIDLSKDTVNDKVRTNLIAAARSLIRELETPVESITRIAWAEVCLVGSLGTNC